MSKGRGSQDSIWVSEKLQRISQGYKLTWVPSQQGLSVVLGSLPGSGSLPEPCIAQSDPLASASIPAAQVDTNHVCDRSHVHTHINTPTWLHTHSIIKRTHIRSHALSLSHTHTHTHTHTHSLSLSLSLSLFSGCLAHRSTFCAETRVQAEAALSTPGAPGAGISDGVDKVGVPSIFLSPQHTRSVARDLGDRGAAGWAAWVSWTLSSCPVQGQDVLH
jgi:hypothetical protein